MARTKNADVMRARRRHYASYILYCLADRQGGPMMIRYLRRTNGVPYGVMVAFREYIEMAPPYAWGQLVCGFSICGPKDHFSRKQALRIAVGRAVCARWRNKPMPKDGYKGMTLGTWIRFIDFAQLWFEQSYPQKNKQPTQ
jgi:hypothetical protein